jgi:hypothetical protein
MEISEIILYFIGATFILKYGAPTKFIRTFFQKWKWGEDLFQCGLCIGTWVGVFSIPLLYKEMTWWMIPFISAITSWFGDLISMTLIANHQSGQQSKKEKSFVSRGSAKSSTRQGQGPKSRSRSRH